MTCVCIDDDVDGLTKGKHYEVISKSNNYGRCDRFLLRNDMNYDTWYDNRPYGIIKILLTTDTWVEYIGNDSQGMTKGKYYQLLDRDEDFDLTDEYYYFLNDFDYFVGYRRINYMNGDEIFRNTSVIRQKKLEDLGI